MKNYFFVVTLLFFSQSLFAQFENCNPSLYSDSLMSAKEKEVLKCFKSIEYKRILNKKNLQYFDSVINQCYKAKLKYLVPNKFYLAGVGYSFSEGLYMSVYIKKFRHLKNRVDQKPWSKKLLMKEIPAIVKIYYYDELVCEIK